MALFFDQDWFSQKLAGMGLSHDDMARAAGVSVTDLAAIWKDQMEVSAGMVQAFAELLGEAPAEIASRCGVSTPQVQDKGPETSQPETGLKEALARIARLEQDVRSLKADMASMQAGSLNHNQDNT